MNVYEITTNMVPGWVGSPVGTGRWAYELFAPDIGFAVELWKNMRASADDGVVIRKVRPAYDRT